jgi:putative heme iron utilization protein
MVSSFIGSNSDELFPVGRLKEHVYAVSPRTIDVLMTVPHAAVAAVGADMFRRVRENTLKWREAAIVTTRLPWVYYLIACNI